MRRLKKVRSAFSVVCSSCGVKIRDAKQSNGSGICLTCFYRILANHLGSQKRTAYGEFVSDR